jgi:hypothetical protein
MDLKKFYNIGVVCKVGITWAKQSVLAEICSLGDATQMYLFFPISCSVSQGGKSSDCQFCFRQYKLT